MAGTIDGRQRRVRPLAESEISGILEGEFENNRQRSLGQLIRVLQTNDRPASNRLVASLQATVRSIDVEPQDRDTAQLVVNAVKSYQQVGALERKRNILFEDVQHYASNLERNNPVGVQSSVSRGIIQQELAITKQHLKETEKLLDVATDKAKRMEIKALRALKPSVSDRRRLVPIQSRVPAFQQPRLSAIVQQGATDYGTHVWQFHQQQLLRQQRSEPLAQLSSQNPPPSGIIAPIFRSSTSSNQVQPFYKQVTSEHNFAVLGGTHSKTQKTDKDTLNFAALGEAPPASTISLANIKIAKNFIAKFTHKYDEKLPFIGTNRPTISEISDMLSGLETMAKHELSTMHIQNYAEEIWPIFSKQSDLRAAGTTASRIGLMLDTLIRLQDVNPTFKAISTHAQRLKKRIISSAFTIRFEELIVNRQALPQTPFIIFYDKFTQSKNHDFRKANQKVMEDVLVNFVLTSREVADLLQKAKQKMMEIPIDDPLLTGEREYSSFDSSDALAQKVTHFDEQVARQLQSPPNDVQDANPMPNSQPPHTKKYNFLQRLLSRVRTKK